MQVQIVCWIFLFCTWKERDYETKSIIIVYINYMTNIIIIIIIIITKYVLFVLWIIIIILFFIHISLFSSGINIIIYYYLTHKLNHHLSVILASLK